MSAVDESIPSPQPQPHKRLEDEAFGEREVAFMKLALAEARKAMKCCLEVPVGCVIVQDDIVIARGFNQTNMMRNATRHCEFVAIDSLQRQRQKERRTPATATAAGARPGPTLRGCELYVSCEPCVMCASALAQMRIERVYFGCHNEHFGGNGSVYALHNRAADHCYESIGGLCKQEAIELFREFYSQGNPNAPDAKRARTLRSGSGAETRDRTDASQQHTQ